MNKSAIPNWVTYRLALRRRRPAGTPFRRVGIYKVDRLGDFVLALGVIQQVVEEFGPENCVLVISPHAAELAHREFANVAQVVLAPGDHRLWRTYGGLRAQRQHPLFLGGVERLLCLRHHRELHEDLAVSAIPAGETWGREDSSLVDHQGELARGRLRFDHPVALAEPSQGECRELALHRSVTGMFLGRELSPVDCVPVLKPVSNFLENVVGVTPFASEALRDFPEPLLIAAGRALAVTAGLPLRLWAPPGQEPRFQSLATRLRAAGVPAVEVKRVPTVSALIEAAANCALVLSADTATAHIAGALDRPLVVLLGGGHPGWFGPWRRSSRQRWLTHSVPCLGCNWNCPHPEPFCITSLDASEVVAAATAALDCVPSLRTVAISP